MNAACESIRSFSPERLEELMRELGQPKFRAKQVHEWLHLHNASSYDEMTNLPKALREQLSQRFPLQETKILQVRESQDGTRKYLLQLDDGLVVECVGILDGSGNKAQGSQHSFGETEDDQAVETEDKRGRLTVCCSTQVGCAMKCSFCATGQQGFERNLTADEIVAQVVAVGKDFGMRVGNVVVMGQGEPFQNYDATIDAMRRMNSDAGLDIGARHITVSTSGLCEEIKRFAKEPEQFRLAISLHAAEQSTRNALMPRLSGQNLKKLRTALAYYVEEKGRRITLEYMLLNELNDTDDDLQHLIAFCEGLNVHVNLLPFNAVDGIDYMPSDHRAVNKWRVALDNAGIPCSVRKSKGSDIAGACGQLKASRFE